MSYGLGLGLRLEHSVKYIHKGVQRGSVSAPL